MNPGLDRPALRLNPRAADSPNQHPPPEDEDAYPVVDAALFGNLRITFDSGPAVLTIDGEPPADPRLGAAAEEPSPA